MVALPPSTRSLYADRPTHLNGASWWHALKRTFMAALDMEIAMRCAGVAYYAFLSLFPAVASAILLFGLVTDLTFVEGRYQDVLELLPEQAGALVDGQIVALLSQDTGSLGLGFLFSISIAVWLGSRGTNAMIYAISRAHYEENLRTILGAVTLSIVGTFAVFVVVLISLFGLAVVPVLTASLPFNDFGEHLALWLRWPILIAIIFGAVCVLFRVAPMREAPRWRWVVPGAFLSTVLWLVASAGFSLYVENFGNYNATFGALAAPVILLLWFYWSSLIFVLGAVLNAELELQTRKDTTTGPSRPIGQRGAYVADNMTKR